MIRYNIIKQRIDPPVLSSRIIIHKILMYNNQYFIQPTDMQYIFYKYFKYRAHI